MKIYITKIIVLEGSAVKKSSSVMREEIRNLLDAEITVLVNGYSLTPRKWDQLVRDSSTYMKDFVCNENGELVEVDYFTYRFR